jgi:hypothetical protein
MVTTLELPGVSVSVENQTAATITSPSSRPLIVLATRSDKTLPDGTGTAAGTSESGALRFVTSQREVRQSLGDPVFVTSGGLPVHGHETNEYGLHALWSFLRGSSAAYYIRADIDLGQLVATTEEPTSPVPDNTYWIEEDAIVGGVFRRNNANTAWEAVPFRIFKTTPSGGSAGDWAFDYTTTNATLKFKADDATWYAVGGVNLTTTNINARTATNNVLWVSATAPTGAGANDFWWKTTSASGGVSTPVRYYRALDGVWVDATVVRSATQPTLAAGTVWEDISTVATNGYRPLKISNGSSYITLTYTISEDAPTSPPDDGQLWFDSSIDDFAMYVEDTNAWEEIVTTTSASPNDRQKVISASAPATPGTGAIWVDISGANLDAFPVVKRYNGSSWENITASVSMTDTYTAASAVVNGTYWINTGDPRTRNLVKVWDSTFTPVVLDSGVPDSFDLAAHRRWKPFVGARFGRRGVRYAVVRALQAAISTNEDIRSDAYRFDLIAVPGYPELYDEMVNLNADIGETAFAIADVPARTIPSGVPTGIEQTIVSWRTNAAVADSTGEQGFTSTGYAQAAHYYPWALSTNTDGEDVFVPASTYALRTYAYNDQVAYPWFAPMGDERGLVLNASSVGYLGNDGEYHPVNVSKGAGGAMYTAYINPTVFYHDAGLRIMGQKTALGVANDMDRVNVARLVARIRWDLQRSLRSFIGRPNDPLTWASAQNLVTKYFAGLKSLRAVSDYAVRCNGQTNTPDRIARNELWVDVAIIPVGAVEFVYVPIRLVVSADQL